MPDQSKFAITRMAKNLADGFIPASLLHQRSSRGLARVFVSTHLVSAIASLAVLVYLSSVEETSDFGLYFIGAMTLVFFALPLVLKRTGNMALVALTSFQTLAITSFVGTFEYGGFASPFLPWILVSLMTGLFYQSQRIGLVLALFMLDVAVFLGFLVWRVQPMLLRDTDLTLLSWISIGAAMSYMAYMALYYARLIASRAELELEAERYRAISVELEQARAAAVALNRTRSLFFSKMSHELRTPLNAIIGYSEILIEDFEDAPVANAQYVADLGRINSTGRHLLSLVADVLDVQTMENSESTIDLATFTLGQLCDGVVAAAKPLIEAKGNRLVIDCTQPDDEVTTDSKKLRQMIINLLSNAAKFTTDGTITLELWIERNAPDDRLHAAVFDTGIGIAPEALPKLFENYVQADKSIQGRFGGTGIGLSLTRKFAGLLGGTVTAESQLGRGSSFTIDIPANAKALDTKTPDKAPAPIAALKLAEAGTR